MQHLLIHVVEQTEPREKLSMLIDSARSKLFFEIINLILLIRRY